MGDTPNVHAGEDVTAMIAREPYGIVVGIEIINMTKKSLVDFSSKIHWGKISMAALRVPPQSQRVMVSS